MAIVRRSYIAVLLLLFAFHANAQRKNLLVRTLDWGYQLVQGDSANPKKKYFFVVPIVSYKPETRWQLGVSFAHYFRARQNDSLTRPSVVRLNVSYTQNNQWSLRPQFDVFTTANKYNLRGTFQYMKFIENYWGIGKGTRAEAKELYGFYQEKADFKTMRKVRKGVYAGIQFNYEHLHGLTNPADGPMRSSGIDGVNGYRVLGFGPAVSFDTRDHIYFPKHGHFVDLYSAFYLDPLSSTRRFNTIVMDARKYVGLWKENVLAFQLYGNFGMGNVPYRMMGTLGNESYMRGYYFGRYRDLNAIAVQAEFRKHIWGPASMVVFGGAGNVSHAVDGLIYDIKPMYGIGVRMLAIPREKINMRLDYGRGINGIEGIYITLNEAF